MLFIIRFAFVIMISWFLLFLFGSATMIDPALDDKAWWSQYLGNILAGSPLIFACLAALLFCLWPAKRKKRAVDEGFASSM
jgi:hypothetical protein